MIVQSGVVVYAQQTLEGWLVGLIPGYHSYHSFLYQEISLWFKNLSNQSNKCIPEIYCSG